MENGTSQEEATGERAAGTQQLPASILEKQYANPYVGNLLKKELPMSTTMDAPLKQEEQAVESAESFDFLSKVNTNAVEAEPQTRPLFGKRKQSFNSQYSKGSGGSKKAAA